MITVSIPEQALELFRLYAEDAGNWSGVPLAGSGGNVCLLGEKEDRGLLTHCKIAGLIKTFREERCIWIKFTDLGRELAEQKFGIRIQ